MPLAKVDYDVPVQKLFSSVTLESAIPLCFLFVRHILYGLCVNEYEILFTLLIKSDHQKQ